MSKIKTKVLTTTNNQELSEAQKENARTNIGAQNRLKVKVGSVVTLTPKEDDAGKYTEIDAGVGIHSGAGIDIDDEGNVSVKMGSGLRLDSEGRVEVIDEHIELREGENVTLKADGNTVTISAKNTTYDSATQSDAGLMSAADKKTLDTIKRDYSTKTYVDEHINDTVAHTTSEQKRAWDAKYDRPTAGIPKSDLSTDVQNSLGKADTALQSHQSLAEYAKTADVNTALDGKVDKVDGKGLSTNDFTDALKDKLDGIEAKANNYVHPVAEDGEVSPAAVCIGHDALGHVVLGNTITKHDIGLENVDNTSDLGKPISNKTRDALNLKADAESVYNKTEIDAIVAELKARATFMDEAAWEVAKTDPKNQDPSKVFYVSTSTEGEDHYNVFVWDATAKVFQEVDEASISLDDYAKTADVNDALAKKVDKESGKGLSSNDFTNELKEKLDGIEAGAQKNVAVTWDDLKEDAKEDIPDPAGKVNVTIKVNGETAGTFNVDQSADSSVDIQVPNPKAGDGIAIVNDSVSAHIGNGLVFGTPALGKTAPVEVAVASTTTFGGVKIGNGINVAEDGTISLPETAKLVNGNGISLNEKPGNEVEVALKPATATEIGGVKEGAGLSIDSDGTISVSERPLAYFFGDFSGKLASGETVIFDRPKMSAATMDETGLVTINSTANKLTLLVNETVVGNVTDAHAFLLNRIAIVDENGEEVSFSQDYYHSETGSSSLTLSFTLNQTETPVSRQYKVVFGGVSVDATNAFVHVTFSIVEEVYAQYNGEASESEKYIGVNPISIDETNHIKLLYDESQFEVKDFGGIHRITAKVLDPENPDNIAAGMVSKDTFQKLNNVIAGRIVESIPLGICNQFAPVGAGTRYSYLFRPSIEFEMNNLTTARILTSNASANRTQVQISVFEVDETQPTVILHAVWNSSLITLDKDKGEHIIRAISDMTDNWEYTLKPEGLYYVCFLCLNQQLTTIGINNYATEDMGNYDLAYVQYNAETYGKVDIAPEALGQTGLAQFKPYIGFRNEE